MGELDLSPIEKFYSGQNVLVTGATGFLGTILVEKLLRSCKELSTIYVLVRNKKGKNLQARINEMFDAPVFARLRTEVPKFQHKIVGVSGDCSLPDLGLSLQDRQMLISQVSVVFHVAATVRFDEKLKIAVAINVRATQEILKMGQEMPNLKALVHVSTAYSQVPHHTIEEKFYPSPVDGQKLILLVETMADNVLDNITPMILGKWPNTYTYTKAVAESIVLRSGYNLPVAVFRPSIVISTYKEPIPGWINNLYGPTGVVAGAGSGVLRALHTKPELNANLVPVDFCVNSLIATAWEVSTIFQETRSKSLPFETPIYHYESSNDQPITWDKFMYLASKHGLKVPPSKAVWYYSFHLYPNYFLYFLTILIVHYIPAILVDCVFLCLGKPPKMLKIYKKIHKFTNVIAYFSTRNWTFKSTNTRNLIAKLSQKDQETFSCNLCKLDWDCYFDGYLKGIRVYLMQDPLETVPYGKIRFRRLFILHQLVKILIWYLLVRLIWWFFTRML